MKISKSFKIYINIAFALLFTSYVSADPELPKNVVVHNKPLTINNLKFKDINLQEVDLSKNKGNIVIINFWASWCLPCEKEMPSLEKLAQNFTEIQIYPINMEPPNKLRARDFYKKIGVVNLDIYFDPKLELVKKFNMRGLPTTILIDKKGNEFGRIIGEIDFYSKEFLDFIKKYI